MGSRQKTERTLKDRKSPKRQKEPCTLGKDGRVTKQIVQNGSEKERDCELAE